MDDGFRWDATIWKAAQLLSQRLQASLDDPIAQTVTLSREEALVTLGIMDGVVEMIELAR